MICFDVKKTYSPWNHGELEAPGARAFGDRYAVFACFLFFTAFPFVFHLFKPRQTITNEVLKKAFPEIYHCLCVFPRFLVVELS
jgi:hypothetical protein